jgi:hypothetical protein
MPFQVLRHSSAESVGFEPTTSAETLADTLATALYAGTDDLLKTAPGNQDVTKWRYLRLSRVTALWFCI